MKDCRILRSSHTGFTVSDLKRAADFFGGLLGFELTEPVRQSGEAVEKMTGVPGAVLDIQFVHGFGYTVELQHYLQPSEVVPSSSRPCDPGFAHIAFEVDDIYAVAMQLSSAGYVLVSTPQVVPAGPRKGGKNIYVRGPDNIVIEFQGAPPVSTNRSSP